MSLTAAENLEKAAQVYCTYCDHRYLPRALALIDSLRRQGCHDDVWVCCLNQTCFDMLVPLKRAGVHAVQLSDLEQSYPRLCDVKSSRSRIEYYFTCTPFLIEYVLANAPMATHVAYVDADLWYFADPDRVFAAMGDAPVAIIPHNFSARNRWRARYGTFNVGWVGFSRSEEGLRCLAWWRDSCFEWCFDRLEGGKYADQLYLDRFAEIAPGTRIIRDKGCNAAPWNLDNYRVTQRGSTMYLDEDPLVFFHFHGVKTGLLGRIYDVHRRYGAPHSPVIRDAIYKLYVANWLAHEPAASAPAPSLRRKTSRGNINVADWGVRAVTTFRQLLDLVTGYSYSAKRPTV